MARKDHYLDHLATVPLLAGCTKEQLQEVASIADELKIPAGTTIITEGAAGHDFIIIVGGNASVRHGNSEIATLGPGSMTGELSLLTHQPRSATVVATTDMEVLVVEERLFNTLLEDVPGLARRMLQGLAIRLRKAEGAAAQ